MLLTRQHLMSTVLYRKYRARKFSEIRGQEAVVKILTNAVLQNRMAHAYLFAGPRGTGKTSMARLLAKAANSPDFLKHKDIDPDSEVSIQIDESNYLDLIEIDAASNRGIEEIRQIKESVNFRPSQGKFKVYIIDEVHMLTREAFNALLKTLEEPPKHVIFVLATTEPHKVPDTILSRVQRFDFRLATKAEMDDKLMHILESEGVKAEPEVLEMLYQHSSGSFRDAESVLGKIIMEQSEGIELLTKDHVRATLGMAPVKQVSEFTQYILDRNLDSLNLLEQVYKEGVNLRLFLNQVVTLLRNNLIESAKTGSVDGEVTQVLRKVLQTVNEFRYVDDTKVVIELMLIELGGKTANIPTSKVKSVGGTKISITETPKEQQKTKHKAESKIYSKPQKAQLSKWKMVMKEVRNHDFKLWAYLRPVEVEESDSKLIIRTSYKNVLSQIQTEKFLKTLTDAVVKVYDVSNLEFEVTDDPSQNPLSNEEMVEATF